MGILVGVMGLSLFKNPRKTQNGVATCHAARSTDVLGLGDLGTSAVGVCLRWFWGHSIGAGRPVLARRAAPKKTPAVGPLDASSKLQPPKFRERA